MKKIVYEDTQSCLNKIHEINYRFLKDFDAVCARHGIHYTLAAGSLLGAIRHKDFIPWDNDVDVSMFRPEFIKLVPYLKAELDPELYELVLPEDYGKKYRDMVPYIAYKKTHIAVDPEFDRFYEYKASRMTLDFFLFDRIPDNFSGKLQCMHLEFLYGMLNAHRYSIEYTHYSGVMKAAAFILNVLGKLSGAEHLRKRVEKVAMRHDADANVKTLTITNDLMEAFGYRFPAEWYRSGRREPIAENAYPVPMEAEKALTMHFGDFMTLPPKEKQVPHLSIIGIFGDDTLTPDMYEFYED